jgi:hypothetical protein
MSTLPFIQPPVAHAPRRVGNANSGILEIPVLGGLTVEESATVTDLLSSEQSAFVEGAQIADGIAVEESISLLEAFELVEASLSGKELEPAAEAIRVKHADAIQRVARIYAASGQRNMDANVTAILRCRLNLPSWGTADTRKLDKTLYSDIWQLVQDEQSAEGREIEPTSEAELKKPSPASGKGMKRTGRKSPSTCSTDSPANSTETPSAANCAIPS